jgi:UDP-N-acetylmuramoyl-tripeptide--D-alanyl-D-alanine ligase
VSGWPILLLALDGARFHRGVAWLTVACCLLACVPSGLRWLRVAQREHYLAGSVTRFAARWWGSTIVNIVLSIVALAAAVASLRWPVAGVAVAAVVTAGPLGLTLRGRTSALAWTRRLRTLAAVWAVLELVVFVVGLASGLAAPLAVVAALVVPGLVDLACAVTAPLEHRLSAHFVEEAKARLQRVAPIVVAITGSYGKTSTKGHIAHLVAPGRTVVATPASFNNRAGLARAINEHLADGTEVFVAEMGTYGPGEIADLCGWCPPDIAVITAVGPVHLERFGSEDRILAAKSEIIERARDVVLQVDDPRLAALADQAAARGKRVLRCSASDHSADVCVVRAVGGDRVSVFVHGAAMAEGVTVPAGVQPTNLACAVAVALALDVDGATVASRLHDLTAVDHRQQAVRSEAGVAIIDDTYNANPAGASAALAALVNAANAANAFNAANGTDGSVPTAGATAADGGGRVRPEGQQRTVVVTPGMVELGPRQNEENRTFGAAIASEATDLVIVGRTNRRALQAGAASVADSGTAVTLVPNRDRAVEWVRGHLGVGDVVLYENDLPDHYP